MAEQPSHAGQDAPSSSDSAISSPRTSTDSRSPHSRPPSMRLAHIPSQNSSHRQSFSESLRSMPQSPRARRQPSLTQAAIQGLIDNPPVRNPADPAFSGRDWRQISIGELVKSIDLQFVEVDTGIEDATKVLVDTEVPVLLVRETVDDKSAVGTFGYSDLNAYLLLVVGLAKPTESQLTSFQDVAQKAQEGSKIPLKDIRDLVPKEPLTTLPASANLMTAVETFGGGVHRIVVLKEDSNEVIGVVSQSRLVKFLWENGQSFPIIDQLYPQHLKDLRLGSQRVIHINGDKPLYHALQLMNDEGISSLAVVDNHTNVVGNISTVDVKLLTKSTSLPLLQNTCIHFISVILSTRGLVEGKDSFPVFYVTPTSTLAHTVAKMVATKSHRLWMADPQSPSSSGSATPAITSTHIPPPGSPGAPASLAAPQYNPSNHGSSGVPPPPGYTHPHHPIPPQGYQGSTSTLPSPIAPSVPASALPGARLSGRLVGVVSLTDVLFLYARASGLSPNDPAETRNRRRRSSSSSLSVHKSGDIGRDLLRGRTGEDR
ncbi:CBS domain protein [Talaromyces proteolyticus]|uniref:Protein SDS23 n=1 Tax=Talaromyces proteolyticus TaxID=1131652 RepID=A0AAD4KUM9_9EURO|nr:CBS domain protein [Talaromyces proteolyticus]KAH8697131.1 CBS domain protein [Talaromyces proteolyticus]